MKKLYTAIFAIAFSFIQFQPLSANESEQVDPDFEMVDFVNIRDVSSEMFQNIMSGKLPNLAIEFSEGDIFPLELFLDGDLITMLKPEGVTNQVQFNRTVLVRNKNGKLRFSTDYNYWRPFRGFASGQIHGGINVEDQETGPVISFGVELNERERHSND